MGYGGDFVAPSAANNLLFFKRPVPAGRFILFSMRTLDPI